MRRGLLATCYVRSSADVRALVEEAYAGSAVVRVLPEGIEPEIARVQGTDSAEIGVFTDGATGMWIVICAIDNLGKGAAGQAVQNLNLALGLRETTGLAARERAGMSVTAAKGFVASGVAAGIRRQGRKDLAIVRSVPPAVGAAMFTRNNVQAACLQVSREHLALAEPQAVVINSGVANAATGERGKLDALATTAEAARLLDLDAEEVLVLSTG